jgi:DNA repair protein RadC
MTTSAPVSKRRPVNRVLSLQPAQLSSEEQEGVIALALAILQHRHRPGDLLESPAQTRNFLRLRLAEHTAEAFGCVFLDSAHRVLDVRELFHGTIDGAAVYPRVVVQQALTLNAAAILFYHNHPSGVAEPSKADERITERLQSALALIDVRVLDHVVVSAVDAVSFAERGIL